MTTTFLVAVGSVGWSFITLGSAACCAGDAVSVGRSGPGLSRICLPLLNVQPRCDSTIEN